MRALVLVAASGCWTGGETTASEPTVANVASEPVAASADGFKVKLERTACMGTCPTYIVTIHGDGRVDWEGRQHVLATGARRGHVTAQEITQLDRTIDDLRFFERDEYGHLPIKPECTTTNGTTTCSMGGSFSFCSDTSHSVFTVTRKHRTHTVDSANCSMDDEMSVLEDLVNRIANVRGWVGSE